MVFPSSLRLILDKLSRSSRILIALHTLKPPIQPIPMPILLNATVRIETSRPLGNKSTNTKVLPRPGFEKPAPPPRPSHTPKEKVKENGWAYAYRMNRERKSRQALANTCAPDTSPDMFTKREPAPHVQRPSGLTLTRPGQAPRVKALEVVEERPVEESPPSSSGKSAISRPQRLPPPPEDVEWSDESDDDA